MGQSDRQARIAQLRAQIEQLQRELAQLELEEERGPYQEYLERVRAAGQTPKLQAEIERYITAHAQLEAEWTRLGRPAQGYPRLSVLHRLREMLVLPPLPVSGTSPSAAATPATPAGRGTAPATAAAPASPNGTPGPATYVPPVVPREQLIEMHNPILNEIVELNKRAVEEFKNGKVQDGIISAERSTYLLERVAHAPPAMQNAVIKIADDSLRLTGVTENDRARLARVKERATELSKSASSHP
jgi:hypothetical protein